MVQPSLGSQVVKIARKRHFVPPPGEPDRWIHARNFRRYRKVLDARLLCDLAKSYALNFTNATVSWNSCGIET